MCPGDIGAHFIATYIVLVFGFRKLFGFAIVGFITSTLIFIIVFLTLNFKFVTSSLVDITVLLCSYPLLCTVLLRSYPLLCTVLLCSYPLLCTVLLCSYPLLCNRYTSITRHLFATRGANHLYISRGRILFFTRIPYRREHKKQIKNQFGLSLIG